MASPQIEDGYTRIANELLEALARIRIPGEAMQIFMVILRKTYGFQKREDAISLSQFCLHTGIKRQNASRSIKQLESMRLISVIKNDDRKPQTFRINKDYSQWRPLSKKITALSKMITDAVEYQQNQGEAGNGAVIKSDDSVKSVIKNDSKLSSKVMHTKEIKKTTTSSSKISFNPETGKFENLDGNVERWRLTYAGVDILSELQKAECWIMANPGRAKKNWERFIVNWLCKAHEKALANGKHIQERQRYY